MIAAPASERFRHRAGPNGRPSTAEEPAAAPYQAWATRCGWNSRITRTAATPLRPTDDPRHGTFVGHSAPGSLRSPSAPWPT
ncbi:MAG: hypothetical protein ACK462_07925, partial [Planctomyces sp.]